MLIDSISMRNFECYSGDHEVNKFKFSTGVNIIIGDNGGGKSKLFNAFYWVLYDQIFDSDRRVFVPTRQYLENLISDKAKKNCLVGEWVDCDVSLTVYSQKSGRRYRIIRIFKAKKIGEREWSCEKSSKLLVELNKLGVWSSVPSDQHDGVLKMIIPPALKPYMWFQGEQVDGLMDFTDKSSLTHIINLLSDINIYDELIEVSKYGLEGAEKKYNSEVKRLSRDESTTTLLTTQLETVEKSISDAKESIEINTKNKNEANSKIEGLFSQVDDAEIKSGYKKEAKMLSDINIELQKDLEQHQNGFNKKMFSGFWVLKYAEPFFQAYSNKFEEFQYKHLQAESADKDVIQELPINIPQPVYLNKMLKQEKCFVCGSEAKKGSDCYNHMEGLLDRDKIENQKLFKNDCLSLFQNIYDNGLGFKRAIGRIDEDISETFKKINGINNDINSNKDRLAGIRKEFNVLMENDTSEDVVKAFYQHKENVETYESLLRGHHQSLKENEDLRTELKKRFAGLASGAIDEKFEEIKDIFVKLRDVCESTRDRVFTDLIKKLQSSANDIYTSMAEKNMSITGSVELKKLSDGCYLPEIVDSDGHMIKGANDSNIILVKLALIMAIITSTERWSQHYCLISDAPTSKMAENYTQGFYRELGKQFTQSIIMTYDFLSEESRSMLSEFKIGKVYKIKSNFPGGNRNDRSDLNVIIEELIQ